MNRVPRQSDAAMRRLANAETVVEPGSRAGAEAAQLRLQLAGAPGAGAPRAIIRIDRPGTYRLAADVLGAEQTVGILITADHVTLDLAGFSVVGKPGALSGIHAMGVLTNISVRNGTVRGWSGHGVDLADASESRVEDLRVTGNSNDGVSLGANGSVSCVESWGNGRDGIRVGAGSSVRDCTARANAGAGLRLGDAAFAENCVAAANAREGIAGGAGAVVSWCVSRHNHAGGIVVGDLAAVRSCEVVRNDGAGIRAGQDASLSDNRCLGVTPETAIVAGVGAEQRNNITPTAGGGPA